MMTTRRVAAEDTEAIIARVLSDPRTQDENADGGVAAVGFIREAAAGLHNPPAGSKERAEREAARQAKLRALLTRIQAGAR